MKGHQSCSAIYDGLDMWSLNICKQIVCVLDHRGRYTQVREEAVSPVANSVCYDPVYAA